MELHLCPECESFVKPSWTNCRACGASLAPPVRDSTPAEDAPLSDDEANTSSVNEEAVESAGVESESHSETAQEAEPGETGTQDESADESADESHAETETSSEEAYTSDDATAETIEVNETLEEPKNEEHITSETGTGAEATPPASWTTAAAPEATSSAYIRSRLHDIPPAGTSLPTVSHTASTPPDTSSGTFEPVDWSTYKAPEIPAHMAAEGEARREKNLKIFVQAQRERYLKKAFAILLAVCVIGLGVFAFLRINAKGETQSSTPSTTATTTPSDRTAWTRYVAPNQTYAVLLPGAISTNNTSADNHSIIETTGTISEKQTTAFVTAKDLGFPSAGMKWSRSDGILRDRLQSLAHQLQVIAADAQVTTVGEHRLLTARMENATKTQFVDIQIFTIDNTLYSISLTTPTVDGNPEYFSKITDSFQTL